MDRDYSETLHRAKLKHHLSVDELTLPDVEREELLIQREFVGRGLLRDMDLCVNITSIKKLARDLAFSRNKFTFWTWFETLPVWLQSTLLTLGIASIFIIISIITRS